MKLQKVPSTKGYQKFLCILYPTISCLRAAIKLIPFVPTPKGGAKSRSCAESRFKPRPIFVLRRLISVLG